MGILTVFKQRLCYFQMYTHFLNEMVCLMASQMDWFLAGISEAVGLLQMQLDEPVKLEVCFLLQHLCDSQLRHRVESIVNFSEDFVAECQAVSLIKTWIMGADISFISHFYQCNLN